MQTADVGGENKEPKAPEVQPVIKTEEKKPEPEAGTEKKEDKPNETVQLLDAANSALEAAENKIVQLKRELKQKGGGESSGDIEDIRESVESLKAEIEELKSTKPSEEDGTVKELQETRKKLFELSKTIVSQNTTGKGEGTSKDSMVPAPIEPEPLAKTPEELAIFARRGLDKFGKKIVKK